MAEQQFNKEMGAVCISPSGGIWSGADWRHRGPNQTNPPEGWMNITASKYLRKTSYLGRIVPASLDEVVRSDIVTSNKTVLIIVHMVRALTNADPKTIEQQVKVISAAKEKGISIYVADRAKPDSKILLKDIPNTLIAGLNKATKGYLHLQYYAGLPGCALQGKDCAGGTLMRDDLVKHSVSMAIVIGQAYGQCVDSTILGYQGPTPNEYYQGLLDIKISVVTAREVLDPPEKIERGSPYFKFNMGPDIQLPSPAAPPQSGKARGDVLGCATNASIDAATNTDAALTHAGLDPTH